LLHVIGEQQSVSVLHLLKLVFPVHDELLQKLLIHSNPLQHSFEFVQDCEIGLHVSHIPLIHSKPLQHSFEYEHFVFFDLQQTS